MIAMIAIGIGGLILVGLGLLMYWVTEWDWEWGSVIMIVMGCLAILTFLICFPLWIGAGREAKVVNKLYDLEVTQEEMFWSGDIIKDYYIGPLERKENKITADVRIEGLNGSQDR